MAILPLTTRLVDPTFRVTCWHRLQPPAGVELMDMGYFARERTISEADVEEALAWTRVQVRERESWTLRVVIRCPEGAGRELLLASTEPTTWERSRTRQK